MNPKLAHVIGGGTHFHVRPHLALSAPAYGATARQITALLEARGQATRLHLTRMAGGDRDLDTNADVERLVEALVGDPTTRLLFMPVALTDYVGEIQRDGLPTLSGKGAPRLRTAEGDQVLHLSPATKVIGNVRRQRKDIFLVGFKTTAGAHADAQFTQGLELLKRSSWNLVLANDLHTRMNMVITPEGACYHVTTDRESALVGLVEMSLLRSDLTFTRSTVIEGSDARSATWPIRSCRGGVPTTCRGATPPPVDRAA